MSITGSLHVQSEACVQFIYMQKDNVANQREHLILLLANVHIRQLSMPDQHPKVLFCSDFCGLYFYLLSQSLCSNNELHTPLAG